ncbi:CPBP family intramembrane glutamic endopeptidase [Chungangia koreensis]|uniref:CPBP family intramembrane glutamic endopeptidase n=1 Tax=Chungangia koreensis TaxID=752657 RepID=A0ABV8X3Q1_9LACT
MKSKRTALYILITYIVMQLSGLLFAPLLFAFFTSSGMDQSKAELLASGWWIFVSMLAAVIIVAIFGWKDKKFFDVFKGVKSPTWLVIVWGIVGFFLVLFGQMLAGMIEQQMFGIDPGSQNTMNLIEIAKVAPVAIFAIAFFAPILEELIFRRVIFASLMKKTNFFVSAAVSAIVFAIIHIDFSHILLYAVSGFIFAFLYHRTKRLLTSIIAHMLLNGFVVLINLNQDKIQQFIEYMEQLQKTGM